MTDYYEILQVSPSAELEVIQAAYKRLAFKYHPDRNHAPDAHNRMLELNEAHEVLSDPDRRRAYDATRRGPSGTHSQTTANQQPSPEVVRQGRELGQYINLLLDRDERIDAVVQSMVVKGLDRDSACFVLEAVLANRLAAILPGSGGATERASPEQMKLIRQIAAYVRLRLNHGLPASSITEKLVGIGFSHEHAQTMVDGIQKESVNSSNDGLAAFLSVLKVIFPPIKPDHTPVLYGAGIMGFMWIAGTRFDKMPIYVAVVGPFLCTTIGVLVTLFQAHQQYRKSRHDPQNGTTPPVLNWESLPRSDRVGLISRWLLVFLIWLWGVGPGVTRYISYEMGFAEGKEIGKHTGQARNFANAKQYEKAIGEYTQAISLIEKELGPI